MKFKNKVGPVYFVVTIGLLGLTAFIAISKYLEKGTLTQDAIPLIILSLVNAYLFFFIFRRKGRYVIDDEYVHYNMFPLKGKVKIDSIKKIEVNKKLWAGLKASTSIYGMIIHFNTYDEIAISPVRTSEFINLLKEKNPKIEILL